MSIETTFSKFNKLLTAALFCFISVTVHAALPNLANPYIAAAPAGVAFSRTLTFTADPPLQFADVLNLPAGLVASHDGAGNLLISGTVAAAGNYPITATAINAEGARNVAIKLGIFSTLQGASNLSLSNFGGCAIVSGALQCWGNRNQPPIVLVVAGVTALSYSSGKWVCVSSPNPSGGAGPYNDCGVERHICAIANRGVQCWGYNNAGQLGSSALPTIVGATAIATGAEHSCAVVNGGVQCWGGNLYGQLGNNSMVSGADPVQAIPALSGVTSLAAGSFHTCAVVAGGLQCWGYKQGYKGIAGNSLVPLPIPEAGFQNGTVHASGNSTCVLKNGGVICSPPTSTSTATATTATASWRTAFEAGSGVTSVAVAPGSSANCAVVKGNVVCWNWVPSDLPSGVRTLMEGDFGGAATDVALAVSGYDRGTQTFYRIGSSMQICASVAGTVRCWGSLDSPISCESIGRAGNVCSTPYSTAKNYIWQTPIEGRAPTALRRTYSAQLRTHLYTTDANEYNVLGTVGWTREGETGYLANSPNVFSTPFHRLYNTTLQRHLWTTDQNEVNVLISGSWLYDGLVGYLLRR